MKHILLPTTFHGHSSEAVHIHMKRMVHRVMKYIRSRLADPVISDKSVNYKETDQVTDIDLIVQDMTIDYLEKHFPDAGIIAEEGEYIKSCRHATQHLIFYLDMLDGTRALIRKQSDGIGVLLSLTYRVNGCDEVIAVSIGDVKTQEVYSYSPGRDVWREHEMLSEQLMYTDKTHRRLLVLQDIRRFPQFIQDMSVPGEGYYHSVDQSNGSIGTNAAKLFKGEVDAMVLAAGKATPWDMMPIIGMAQELGYVFVRFAPSHDDKVWYIFDGKQFGFSKIREQELMLIVHISQIVSVKQYLRETLGLLLVETVVSSGGVPMKKWYEKSFFGYIVTICILILNYNHTTGFLSVWFFYKKIMIYYFLFFLKKLRTFLYTYSCNLAYNTYIFMANLRDIKSKIKSVKNLKKITRALEVVSTVKLQKTKDQADSLKKYLVDLLAILSQVGQKIDIFAGGDATPTASGKKLIIILTSERGLCGALNSKLLRKIYKDESFDGEVDYFVIGKKGLEYLKRAQANIVGSLHIGDTFTQKDLLPLYSYFDEAVATGSYESISLYFNYFKNSILQIPTSVSLVPFDKDNFQSFIDDLELEYTLPTSNDHKDLMIEPDLESYVAEMKRQVRNYIINAALVQNKTGEHAARMIAMKNAKDNATDFVKSLTLSFNKARQGAITQEISEIVAAKIAIE